MPVCCFVLQYVGMLFCFTVCRYVVLFHNTPVIFILQYADMFLVVQYTSKLGVFSHVVGFFLQYAGMLSLILCVEVAGCTLGVVFKSSVI